MLMTKATTTLATAVALLLLLGVVLPGVHAQAPCNMFCPIGAGVTDSFDSGGAAVRGGVLLGGSGASPVLTSTAQVDFMIPPVPLNKSASVTSTLFSGIQSFYGGTTAATATDVYQGVATLTFVEWLGAWTLQSLIQHNGQTVASGQLLILQPGHVVSSTILQPLLPGQPLEVQMADPYQGFSQAQYFGLPLALASANQWLVGWGWDGVDGVDGTEGGDSGGANCALLPPGGSLLLNQIVAYDTNNQLIPLNFTAANTMQPFCQLAATSHTPPMDPASVTFTWVN